MGYCGFKRARRKRRGGCGIRGKDKRGKVKREVNTAHGKNGVCGNCREEDGLARATISTRIVFFEQMPQKRLHGDATQREVKFN